MTINFIPNDPKAVAELPMRQVIPRSNRPATEAGFNVSGAVVEGEYAVGTPEFLHWQCREAALAAAEAWFEIHGTFPSWHAGTIIPVTIDEGEDLNAYYDRKRGTQPERLGFYHKKVGNKTYYSGASAEVVAHEVGHGLLDAIRPDFWGSARFEVNSFHEAFGDCMALITGLHDKGSREKVRSSIALDNPVETLTEELAEGIKKSIPTHNAGLPRKARNNFQWGPEGSLPDDGGPGELIYEEHSFGQVFSGCFYDTIVNIFNGMSSQSEANLLAATQTAGKLLVKAVKQAPQRSQYFREVGRVMILVDEQDNAAANRSAIRDAFDRHGLALGSTLTVAPQVVIAPDASPRGVVSRRIPAAIPSIVGVAKRELLKLIGAETTKLVVSAVDIAGNALQQAVHQRLVPLDAIHKKLRGVVAEAAQVALVGKSHNALSIMGHVSNADATIRDVESYVASLVKHGRIAFESAASGGPRSLVAGGQAAVPPSVTHEVREVRGQKTLVRIRFACRGNC